MTTLTKMRGKSKQKYIRMKHSHQESQQIFNYVKFDNDSWRFALYIET